MNEDRIAEELVHTGAHYEVRVGMFNEHGSKSSGYIHDHGYKVYNRSTGVLEFTAPQLPEALSACEQLDVAMDVKPWTHFREQYGPVEVNPDGSTSELH